MDEEGPFRKLDTTLRDQKKVEPTVQAVELLPKRQPNSLAQANSYLNFQNYKPKR